MSPRSLQRGLARHGLEFRRSPKRRASAARFRSGTQTTRSFEDIAERLGYAETKAFRRAFHRWTGMSPQAFRQASRAR
ncbi:MAG: helix-turn-helix domain-containing protein [Polyangiaceae bacterium]